TLETADKYGHSRALEQIGSPGTLPERPSECPLGVIRYRGNPAASPAMSAVTQKGRVLVLPDGHIVSPRNLLRA
ncbi:hypothetical protein AAFX91_33730, partial [Bradyrhizobium sp. 31Argb]|uniref:hypothetical protein n=1 Tax=Bradyrhizobium sp. 31Argb TaxID=3141247 RepID=UPI00374A8504